MAAPELGTKRACTSCGAKFYDLGKSPAECPKCDEKFYPEILLPAREPRMSDSARNARQKPQPVAAPVAEVEKPDTGDLAVVESVKMRCEEDDEIAAIADVDIGDDDDDDSKDDDTTLLDADNDDDSDVSDLVARGAGRREERLADNLAPVEHLLPCHVAGAENRLGFRRCTGSCALSSSRRSACPQTVWVTSVSATIMTTSRVSATGFSEWGIALTNRRGNMFGTSNGVPVGVISISITRRPSRVVLPQMRGSSTCKSMSASFIL